MAMGIQDVRNPPDVVKPEPLTEGGSLRSALAMLKAAVERPEWLRPTREALELSAVSASGVSQAAYRPSGK